MKDDYEEAYNEINQDDPPVAPMLGRPGMLTQVKKDLMSLNSTMGHVTFKSFIRRMESPDNILGKLILSKRASFRSLNWLHLSS